MSSESGEPLNSKAKADIDEILKSTKLNALDQANDVVDAEGFLGERQTVDRLYMKLRGSLYATGLISSGGKDKWFQTKGLEGQMRASIGVKDPEGKQEYVAVTKRTYEDPQIYTEETYILNNQGEIEYSVTTNNQKKRTVSPGVRWFVKADKEDHPKEVLEKTTQFVGDLTKGLSSINTYSRVKGQSILQKILRL